MTHHTIMAGIAVRRTASLRSAYVPAIHVFDVMHLKKEDVDARAGKLMQPAQAWLQARA
jgi:hypothetical protein